MTDDDVEVHVDWVRAMTRAVLDGDADATAGALRLDVAGRTGLGPRARLMLAESLFLHQERPPLIGASMALRRDLALELGWDERLGPGQLGYGDDLLMYLRLLDAGARIVAVAEPVSVHHPDPSRFDLAVLRRSARRMGEASAYIEHHWSHRPAVAAGPKHMAYSLRAVVLAAISTIARRWFSSTAAQDDLLETERRRGMQKHIGTYRLEPFRYPVRTQQSWESNALQAPTPSYIPSDGDSAVTVVLCVRNGEATIGEQLEALSVQTYAGHWTLMLVDNGSTDGTLDVVRRWAETTTVTTRIVDGRHVRGPAAGRNLGARVAEPGIVLFCDADDVADRNWMCAMVGALGEADVVGGRLRFERINPPALLIPRLTQHILQVNPWSPGGRFVVSANMGVTTAVIAAIGGFDEGFTSAAGEDVDFSWRAKAAGFAIGAAPAAIMDYRLRGSRRQQIRQRHGYGRGEGTLREKHSAAFPQVRVLHEVRFLAKMCAKGLLLIGPKHSAQRADWVDSMAYRTGVHRQLLANSRRGAQPSKSRTRRP